jgi:hypothetical protein
MEAHVRGNLKTFVLLFDVCRSSINSNSTGPSTQLKREPGSSGSILSGYRLDDRAIEIRFPAEARDFFSSLYVQTGSGVHPAS